MSIFVCPNYVSEITFMRIYFLVVNYKILSYAYKPLIHRISLNNRHKVAYTVELG